MKKLKFNLKPVAAAVGATALTLASGAVMAQEAGSIDLTSITSVFNAADVITAVMAVAGVLAAIYATMTAARMALRWIRGG
ncbi:hypothetical protein EV679_2540 [Kerstersia gyiorum]|uniref:Phage coat protein n=1 Tax=Kerstersia gyiorum TaxID=206506 RepID=A0A4Q7MGK0_9BURK|nr:hypothetical protein [Kerstersia gyiorum]KAB0541543.1 hypothetical protein F7P85_16820 [Kerstersia gyiorum]RZS67326.1 hypothetical protein EV679_2540 [Kerstersia gyiorum]